MPFLTVGEVAAQLDVPPKLITDLIYRGRLDRQRCPMQAGRRLIPVAYVPVVASVLRRAGKIEK